MTSIVTQISQSTLVDDEIMALALQLEEIGVFCQSGKGKHAVDRPPDSEIACLNFRTELDNHRTFLLDQRFAHNMGVAVYSDGPVIAETTAEEIQCHEDRLLALRISDGRQYEKLPSSTVKETRDRIQDWISTAPESQYAGSVADFSNDETDAGPSLSYADRQATVLEKLSKQLKCAVCHEMVHSKLTLSLPCKCRYCIDCLKGLFIRATRDESLFPVRCHKEPIPLSIISKHLSREELTAFELASLEFSTGDRVYCSNIDCGMFIPPEHIEPGIHRALCQRCNTYTCGLCKNRFHSKTDCPDDPALHATRHLAEEKGWQTCFRCNSIVVLRSGCNHMTCRCKAEFCYECGVKWKKCKCAHANQLRIEERAEEIVDRDAVFDLPVAERQHRVQEVFAELEQNHECGHPGRFRRMNNTPAWGFRCEMCDASHWKYILQCRHCYINVCEDCRRNRV